MCVCVCCNSLYLQISHSYVVVEELIPESQSGHHSNIATIGVALGFALMMMLDVALG